MLKIKGIAILSTINFLKKSIGEEGYKNFLRNLSVQTQDILNNIKADEWYDIRILVELNEASLRFFKNDKEIWKEIGRHSCEYSFSTIYKIYNDLASPEFIIKRSAQIWNDYYSEGKFKIVSQTQNSACVQVRDVNLVHPSVCIRITGWVEKALELAGAKNINLKHTLCRFSGSILEEWKAKWD